jgi:predicted XRE-type DNA-binding protein
LIKNEWFTIIEKLVTSNALITQNENKQVDIEELLKIEDKRKADLTALGMERKKKIS